MDLKLKDKVVIVTGGGGAIGSAMAKAFAAEGARVVVSDYAPAGMEAVVEEIRSAGGEASGVLCDVGNKHSAEALIEQTVQIYGRVDILINNAGINGGPDARKRTHEYDDALWERIMAVDLDGVYYCSRCAVRQMLKQGTPASIINVSSIAGVQPLRLQVAFTAAKAGVIGLSKAMALEYADAGIRVNVICPGSVMFEGTRKLFYADPTVAEKMMSSIPMYRPGTPEDISAAACVIASDEACGYMTGAVQVIDGGWTSSIRQF